MRYYAHYGHREFILCLGYKADAIKDYFLHYDEAVVERLRADRGRPAGGAAQLDIDDWRITFVDTGHNAIGRRAPVAVERHLEGDEMFLANYGDT